MDRIFKITVFEGDGIGPEIMEPTLHILKQLQETTAGRYKLHFQMAPAGAGHYQKTGEALPQASIDMARKADAILLSAMGLPHIRYPDGTEIVPQIDLRSELDLYAGVRPVRVQGNQHCPLKRPNNETIDFVLIRENTEGLFYTRGKGDVTKDEARETLRITRPVSEKLFRFTFELARTRKATGSGRGHVTCVDKANVFRAFAFFRSIFEECAKEYDDIKIQSAYVDAFALWMVQRPWSFDVLVTENMFGDILSDLGAGLMGGLGLAPSADIGDDHAVFQPCHGSAPDIAGKGVANPIAMIRSAAMMLEWLGNRHDNPYLGHDASRLNLAIDAVLEEGENHTPDLGGTATTEGTAQAVQQKLADFA